jgi:hypothetical protein
MPSFEFACRITDAHSQPLETLGIKPTLEELKKVGPRSGLREKRTWRDEAYPRQGDHGLRAERDSDARVLARVKNNRDRLRRCRTDATNASSYKV